MIATSLKARFSLSIALIYLFLSILTFAAIYISTEYIINSLATRFAIKQALLEKSKLMSEIQQDLTLSLKMANSPLIQQWVADENDQRVKEIARIELESYRQSFEGKCLFIAMASSGHYFFADGSKTDFMVPKYILNEDDKNDAWFFRTLSNVKSFELNIDYDNHLDLNKIWYNVVIHDRSGQKIGLGGSGVDITKFISQVIDIVEPGIETILFNTEGIIEGHKNRKYVIHNSKVRGDEKKVIIYDLIDNEIDRSKTKMAIDQLAHDKSEVEHLSLLISGREYLAAMAYMPEIHWYNLVLVDAKKVVGYRSFLPILLISILSLLCIVVIISVFLNRLVLKRISILANSANRIAKGDFNVSIPVDAKDEIGKLTSAFNEMAFMVRDHSENLEQKVVQRTEELRLANKQLAASNKKIMDSIRYAELIQTTILPAEATVQSVFGEFFALYLPRDIVGGDFYFLRIFHEGWFLAVIDCTGHGVPGAFMTMTANAVLSNIIDTGRQQDPAAIIEMLHQNFQTTLHQNSKDLDIDYGLDIGLCRYDNIDRNLNFCGARIDLHCVRNGEVQTIKGQRKSIGYRRTEKDLHLTNYVIPVENDMYFYLTTDGLLDQAGGDTGWGFGRRRFKKLILEADRLPVEHREEKIRQELALYQGDYLQRDDITVVGFCPKV